MCVNTEMMSANNATDLIMVALVDVVDGGGGDDDDVILIPL